MRRELEAILRLIDDRRPALVTAEDFDGPGGGILRRFDALGFLRTSPGMNPRPSCPYCHAGTPYPLGGGFTCRLCRSAVDRRSMLAWSIDVERFLAWFAESQGLAGGVERVDATLCRLGTHESRSQVAECFFARGAAVSQFAASRLRAFRSVLILHAGDVRPKIPGFDPRFLSLADVLIADDSGLALRPLASFFEEGGAVCYDHESGALSLGDRIIGHVPIGTRESAFMGCLYRYVGHVVPYADIKRDVCRESGSRDTTDEATFCHKRRSRLKQVLGAALIDRLIAADRAQGGYVLRQQATLPASEEG